jgi:hypothetical protein
MTLRLGFAALLVTALYALFTSLWWYPTGQEGPPAEVRMTGIRDQVHGDLPSRGLPVVALERYPDLTLELDGQPVPTNGSAAEQRKNFSLSLRQKPRPKVDPVILSGVPQSSVDITRVEPEDGPRPGDWTREEHWIRAEWTDPSDRSRQVRAWNASEIMRAFGREVGPGQEPEALFLEMGPPVQPAHPLQFALAAVWLLIGIAALATGLCEGKPPRALFGRTLAALALGPIWILLAALLGLGPRRLLRGRG